MIKIKIYKKLLTITLAITSIASIGLISPASANYTKFLSLTGKGYRKIYNILISQDSSSLDSLSNTLNSFKNDINFNNIKTSKEFGKKLDDYLNNQEIAPIAKSAIMPFVKQSIIPAFSKFNKDIAINFLMDYIRIKPSLTENVFVSALQYNYVMDAQFQKAIEKYKNNENPSFDENEGDTLDNLNLTIKSPNGQSINLNQLNITKNDMRHILVGDKTKNNFKKDKGLPVGHTKYAKEGMKILSDIRYNQLKEAMNGSDSFVNFFTHAVGFSPDEYVKSVEKHNDNEYYSIKYYPLNDSNYTIKGMFPDSWEWKDIKTDLKNTIATNNCVYNTISNGKDIAYFYDLTKDKSALVIVNLTDQKFITAIPESLKDLKTSISNDFKGIFAENAIRSISGFRISKKNLERLTDKNLVEKAKDSKFNLNWQDDSDFINIIKKI